MTHRLLKEIFLLNSSLFVLRNANISKKSSINANTVPHQKIPITPSIFSKREPIIGQTINPKPNTAHISQKFFVFSSLVTEISVSTACNIDTFHHVTPLIILDRINTR